MNYWPYLSPNRVVADRTQRDVSANISIALNTFVGIDMTSVVFETFGYNSSAFQSTWNLLNVGFNGFVLDLYYNNYTDDWGLCPQNIMEMNSTVRSSNTTEKQCDPSAFNLEGFIMTLNNFLISTNTVLQTNAMLLLLKLHSISYNSHEFTTNTSSISYEMSLQDAIEPFFINVKQLPTLSTLLRKMQKRVLPVVIESDVENWIPEVDLFYSSSLEQQFANLFTLQSQNFLAIDYQSESLNVCNLDTLRGNSSSIQVAYDSNDEPFTPDTLWSSIMCGYSPVISHAIDNLTDITSFLDVTLWSWAPFQPTAGNDDLMDSQTFKNILNSNDSNKLVQLKQISTSNETVPSSENDTYSDNNNNNNDDDDDDNIFVNRCAVLTSAGWIATSCLNKFHSLCQHKSNLSDIKISDDDSDYIHAPDKCSMLGSYKLYVPKTSIDQLLAIRKIPDGEDAVWIDLNSLSSENCWVVGIYTDCPYQVVISTRLFAEMIIPSSIIALLLLALTIFFQFDTQPVLKNRKYWRKIYAEVDDPDGRPI